MPLEAIDNIVIPSGSGATTCGYCSPPGQRSESATSYHSATLEAIKLTCAAYQDMIDRGWRRSGTYCYKPNLKASCCPQYTIRLDATAFKPSRSQRKLLNRWNRFVLQGESDPNAIDVEQATSAPTRKLNSKSNRSTFTSLAISVHESEFAFQADGNPSHKFEVILEPSSFTPEKFALYKKYQTEIHNDKRNNPTGFKRFLVDSPLQTEPISYSSPPPDHLPLNYGSYHQLYKLDGELVAMGVIDILPNCVSSVYFMYDKKWERWSMGKLSALREASLANEIREAGAPGMGYLYMGFYIYSCQKMRYKGDYSPSYLADPETYEWFPLEHCTPLLKDNKYACFSNSARSCSDDDAEVNSPSPEPVSPVSSYFDDARILCRTDNGDIVAKPIKETSYLCVQQVRDELDTCIRGLGNVAKDVVFAL